MVSFKQLFFNTMIIYTILAVVNTSPVSDVILNKREPKTYEECAAEHAGQKNYNVAKGCKGYAHE
jgi:hypothetical protein